MFKPSEFSNEIKIFNLKTRKFLKILIIWENFQIYAIFKEISKFLFLEVFVHNFLEFQFSTKFQKVQNSKIFKTLKILKM